MIVLGAHYAHTGERRTTLVGLSLQLGETAQQGPDGHDGRTIIEAGSRLPRAPAPEAGGASGSVGPGAASTGDYSVASRRLSELLSRGVLSRV